MSHDLAEKLAIMELKARYFRHLDTKNWAEWRKVFTDDVEVRVDVTVSTGGKPGIAPPLPPGADAFVAHISNHLKDISTVHHGHMPEIALTGPDEATGIWSMEDVVESPGGRIMHGYGHYHEVYRRVDGAWRIHRLHITRLRIDYFGDWPQDPDALVQAQTTLPAQAL